MYLPHAAPHGLQRITYLNPHDNAAPHAACGMRPHAAAALDLSMPRCQPSQWALIQPFKNSQRYLLTIAILKMVSLSP
jgi:hypothetical protein